MVLTAADIGYSRFTLRSEALCRKILAAPNRELSSREEMASNFKRLREFYEG